MYCALIGDWIESREMLPDERKKIQEKLAEALKEINALWSADIAAKFILTLGDEFQGLLTACGPTLAIAEHLIRSVQPHSIRFGIGLGDMYTVINPEMALGADGPAFHLARKGMEALKANPMSTRDFLIRYRTGNADEVLMDVVCDDVSLLMGDWTEKQREIVLAYRNSCSKQKDLASRMAVNASTINRHLKDAKFSHYNNSLERLTDYLVLQYDTKK